MEEEIRIKLSKICDKYVEKYQSKDYRQISKDIITLYYASKLKFVNQPHGNLSLISLQLQISFYDEVSKWLKKQDERDKIRIWE